MVRRWSVPVAVRLSRYRVVTADRVSFFGFVVGGVAAAGLVLADRWILAAGAFVLADFADYIDGDVARAQGTASDRGDILDGVLDRYVDFLILLALTLRGISMSSGGHRSSMAGFGHPPTWTIAVAGALAIFGAIMPSYVRAVASANGRPTPESVGGRGTRNRVIVVAILAAQPAWGLVVVALLANAAALHRIAVSLAREPAPGKDPTEPSVPSGGGRQRRSRRRIRGRQAHAEYVTPHPRRRCARHADPLGGDEGPSVVVVTATHDLRSPDEADRHEANDRGERQDGAEGGGRAGGGCVPDRSALDPLIRSWVRRSAALSIACPPRWMTSALGMKCTVQPTCFMR
jgi:phosphatidylglycerophosphate synthase